MSKLDKLIKEYCPDGVEYKKLGEIASISRGGNFQKKDYVEQGVPCIHYGQIYTYYNLFVNETISFISEEKSKKQKMALTNDIIMAVTSENIDDVCKCIAWLGEELVAVSGHTAIIHHNQNPKYLVYYLHSSMFHKQKRKIAHGTKVIEVTPDKLNEVRIPVPPLEVQSEIVRILDNFTKLTTEFITELTTELAARKKQYVYYRNQLLSFPNEETKYLPMEDVTYNIFSGKNKDKSLNGKYPVYGSTGIIGNTSNYVYDKSQILVARVGANAGFVYTADGKYDVSDNTIIIDLKENYSFRYFYHLLMNINLNRYAKGGGQPLITASQIKKLSVPVPPIKVQERIANTLDNFEAICSDLNIALPIEIEARKKQYEYYRDKLLSFKELSQ